MLDWMKKLLNKEGEQPNNPVPPYENRQVEKREMETRVSYQYPSGKFRFPLVPDERKPIREQKEPPKPIARTQPLQDQFIRPVKEVRPRETPPVTRTIRTEKAPVKALMKAPNRTKMDESNRRPFRPTETISPIFGYNRPSQEELVYRKQQEDLVLSQTGKSVVDAWLEKYGFLTPEPDRAEEVVHIENTAAEETVQQEQSVQELIQEKSWEASVSAEHTDQKQTSTHATSEETSIQESDAEHEELQAVAEIVAEVIAEENLRLHEQEMEDSEGNAVVLSDDETKHVHDIQAVQAEEPTDHEIVQELLPVVEVTDEVLQEMEEVLSVQENTVPEAFGQEETVTKLLPEDGQEMMLQQELIHAEEVLAEENKEVLPMVVQELLPILEEKEAITNESLQAVAETAQTDVKPPVVQEYAEDKAEAQPFKEEQSVVQQPLPVAEEEEAIANASQAVAETAQKEAKPAVVQEEKREKKRFVPYNVVMLKQDKLKYAQKKQAELEKPAYTFPSITLLNVPNHSVGADEEWLNEQKELLNTTFFNFNVGAKVVHVTQGPAVTRFEVQPEPGVKVNKITNLSDDIKLNLAAKDIRIEAPIPGKNAVGIEVPNKQSRPVFMREILRSPVFTKDPSPLTVALGLDISGTPIVTDIRKMPHGLIAGATGSGKSVCINAILTSILYKAMPHEVKLLLIDPKMVELAPYNHIPHLVSPVITDVKAATAALKWAVEEMEKRYEMFAHAGARDLNRYNELVKQKAVGGEPLPYIVIVIDELADLMMVSPADVEEAICRIAQKARACGIHLLVATQRPSVDVITGLIKANIPTRIAFTVSSQVDSRTIIDISGAEKLLGRGDMLFLENGTSKPIRVQGVYVSDEEIERAVAHVKDQMKPNYLFKQEDLLAKVEQHEAEDELFYEACQFVLEQGGASTSSLQRRFRIGYNRAARLIEEMEMQGIISEQRGTKPRDVLITEDELAAMQDMNV